jgi:hypothetical protein
MEKINKKTKQTNEFIDCHLDERIYQLKSLNRGDEIIKKYIEENHVDVTGINMKEAFGKNRTLEENIKLKKAIERHYYFENIVTQLSALDVLYIEKSSKNKKKIVCHYLIDGHSKTLEFDGCLAPLYAMLPKDMYVQVNQTCIVNRGHIAEDGVKQIILDNGADFSWGRDFKKRALERSTESPA